MFPSVIASRQCAIVRSKAGLLKPKRSWPRTPSNGIRPIIIPSVPGGLLQLARPRPNLLDNPTSTLTTTTTTTTLFSPPNRFFVTNMPDAPRRSARLAGNGTAAVSETPAADPAPKIVPAEEDVTELAKIDLGDSLPSLTLQNEKGEDIDVASLAAEKGVVLFLVPKADTAGCTTQACGFRDVYPDFTEHNFDVYCLSADSPSAQTKWQTKKELPYPLISDPDRLLIAALGAKENGKTKRSHFIFEKGGKLVDKRNPVTPTESPPAALEFVKSYNTKASL